MSFPSVDRDPSTVNDESSTAALGHLYYYAGSSNAPEGVYRYVQFKDAVTYVNGHACYVNAISGTQITEVTNDISNALGGTDTSAFAGVCVRVMTENYYGYLLVSGTHDNLTGDGSVGVGDSIFATATT